MNEQELRAQFSSLESKIDSLQQDARKIKFYFKTTLIITVVLFVLPLILAAFAVPAFISNYSTVLEGIQ